VIHELFTRKLFTDTTVVDAVLVHAAVNGADSCSPKKLPPQPNASCASRLLLSQIVRTISTV
jgi:hypothetical protein